MIFNCLNDHKIGIYFWETRNICWINLKTQYHFLSQKKKKRKKLFLICVSSWLCNKVYRHHNICIKNRQVENKSAGREEDGLFFLTGAYYINTLQRPAGQIDATGVINFIFSNPCILLQLFCHNEQLFRRCIPFM